MLTEALELARNNEVDGLPRMAAIISKRKRVVSTGVNSRKSHPMMKRFDDTHLKIYLHAEMAAIIEALRTLKPEQLKGCEIHVARVLKNGQRAKAKPCAVCQKALEEYGIRAIYWTEYED